MKYSGIVGSGMRDTGKQEYLVDGGTGAITIGIPWNRYDAGKEIVPLKGEGFKTFVRCA